MFILYLDNFYDLIVILMIFFHWIEHTIFPL